MNQTFLQHQFLSNEDRDKMLQEILCYKPIWENRFSKSNPPPDGQPNRQLLRPVYWLGNWQFACLNYYHPPKGIKYRCVQAEPYAPMLNKFVNKVESIVRQKFHSKDIPQGWQLNTCLINYYGSKIENGKTTDAARVGEHKDFEPGPVASFSFGERALFQFVQSQGKNAPSQVVLQQWLADNSLQIFAGPKYKDTYFHRVQRVEKNKSKPLPDIPIPDFKTRRINLTFRYVPTQDIQPLHEYPVNLKNDVAPYIAELSKNSKYWKQQVF